jgi:hypothetical protein
MSWTRADQHATLHFEGISFEQSGYLGSGLTNLRPFILRELLLNKVDILDQGWTTCDPLF